MNWFFLIGALAFIFLIGGFIWYVHDDYSDGPAALGFTGGILFLVLVVMGLSLIDKKSDFQIIINEYNNTKALVETSNGADYGNMNELTGKVIAINDKIAKHKAYSVSKWHDLWNSEEIGNLEPIVYGRSIDR